MESLFTFCRWRRLRHSFFSPCDQMQPFDLWCHAAFTVTSTGEKVATNNNCVCRERLLVSQQLLLLLLTTSTVPPTSQVKICLIYSCCLWPYHSVMLVDGEAAGWGALTSQNSNMFSVSMPKSFTLGCGRKRERHKQRERERVRILSLDTGGRFTSWHCVLTHSICRQGNKVFGNSRFLLKTKQTFIYLFSCIWQQNCSILSAHFLLTSLACSRNQALADSALVMVSWVVNVCKRTSRTFLPVDHLHSQMWAVRPVRSSPRQPPYLRCDDEERRLSVELCQCFGDVRSINIGHKPHTWSTFWVRLQSFSHHQGALQSEEQNTNWSWAELNCLNK